MKLDLNNYEIKKTVQSLEPKVDLEAVAGKCRKCFGLVKYREAVESYDGEQKNTYHARCWFK